MPRLRTGTSITQLDCDADIIGSSVMPCGRVYALFTLDACEPIIPEPFKLYIWDGIQWTLISEIQSGAYYGYAYAFWDLVETYCDRQYRVEYSGLSLDFAVSSAVSPPDGNGTPPPPPPPPTPTTGIDYTPYILIGLGISALSLLHQVAKGGKKEKKEKKEQKEMK